VSKLYLSGYFSLQALHTAQPNTSSHTKSISTLRHSRHRFLVFSSARALREGANGPSWLRCSFLIICIRSHSAAVMCAGFCSAPGAAPDGAAPVDMLLFHGSSSVLRKPPLVSVMALKL
jgi:hypothetical protein